MKSKLEDEIDALFTLPLTEFTSVRNTLAARLKKEKRTDEAERVKLLTKPPVSAWAVNQLYWNHRELFDQLIASGERFQNLSLRKPAGWFREVMRRRRTGPTVRRTGLKRRRL